MGNLVLNGSTSGSITVSPTAIAGSNTLTLPALTGTILTSASSTAIFPAGSVIQVVNTLNQTPTSGTGTIPWDNTIPQNTEGNEIMTLAITPKSSTSKLRIDVVVQAYSNAGVLIAALFQDSTANALACGFSENYASSSVSFTEWMTSGTTSSTTFKVRFGRSTAGTYYVNSDGSANLGSTLASSITITEIAA